MRMVKIYKKKSRKKKVIVMIIIINLESRFKI